MNMGFLDMFVLHWSVLPFLIALYLTSYLIAIALQRGGCCSTRFGAESSFDAATAWAKVVSTLNFVIFLMYPGLCLRFVKLYKYTPLLLGGQEKRLLSEDLDVEYGTGRHEFWSSLFMVVGPLFVACACLGGPTQICVAQRCPSNASIPHSSGRAAVLRRLSAHPLQAEDRRGSERPQEA